MKTRDFFFDLPESLIAQKPSHRRSDSRMMMVDRSTGTISHSKTAHLPQNLQSPLVLVRNNSKVRKARVFAQKDSHGGSLEFLFLSRIDTYRWEVMVSRSKKQRRGDTYSFPGSVTGEITDEHTSEGASLKVITTSIALEESYFLTHGHVPLPPYIKREDEGFDERRYQTMYASVVGSVAAPTAGLHMTKGVEQELLDQGIEIVDVTLHVGLGTFLPIRTEHIEEHEMHRESYTISSDAAERINRAKSSGIPVYALGTTSMRTLEASWMDGKVREGTDATNLYITPGYTFNVVDGLFTNFHTPGSTLLVLVSSFAGTDLMRRAYQEAISEGYRFFSYGDAMLIR